MAGVPDFPQVLVARRTTPVLEREDQCAGDEREKDGSRHGEGESEDRLRLLLRSDDESEYRHDQGYGDEYLPTPTNGEGLLERALLLRGMLHRVIRFSRRPRGPARGSSPGPRAPAEPERPRADNATSLRARAPRRYARIRSRPLASVLRERSGSRGMRCKAIGRFSARRRP